ncbi:calcium-translocating P-type ATPase, PMCA-type [Anaerorhabdus sp.]|uniref:calcium-translocating P-type ATPase, PMCA-type n=1 Tax=Anaerorhabdus sp. TaxID=1872524 RepID=UPI002FC614F3
MFYNRTKNQVVEELQSNDQKGLHLSEIETIRSKCGSNELKEEKKQSIFVKFLLQFTDPLIIVLIVAAIVSIVVDPHEWIDSLIILIVVVFNAILGVAQENSAEKSLEALKKMSAPNTKVIRDGERFTIPSRELVVGDVVILEAGDLVPSDGRILESYNLQIDESALTGESVPVNKISDIIELDNCPLGDQKNMAFSSTVVTYGRGKMIVTTVGMENEVGKIASMLMSSEKETTPLQNKLAQISKVIGVMCLGICVIVFGLEWMSGLSVLDSFKTSVALAVAAIPEGLATVVTIVLAIGVTKMVKNNAIVRKLPAVETLGSASVVCSDKTGTLTQNKMTVVKTYTVKNGTEDFNGEGNSDVREMMKCFTLCSDAEMKFENGETKLLGDPTETALIEASFKMGDKKEDLYDLARRGDEIAFDSSRKLMTVFYNTDEGVISITKGAPDVIMSRCINTPSDASDANEQMANQALRVLAVAFRRWKEVPVLLDAKEVESQMTFVGLVGMIDPPRPEAKLAIEEAKQGGIRTIMITGDHVTTAKAIAKDLGILLDGQKAITGTDLSNMTDEELLKDLENISVYARVAPEHKVRIVSMWQSKGHVVAMTGDGVNDSPALKKADIGCAMGITGTDVSKGAADMILTDDNFATIIHAVREGRGIYNNIKKDVQFLLSSNIGEVITIFGASVISLFGINLGVPLLPVHLLWVNLITDTLPAFALGLEPVDKDIMKEKPRPKNESFFAHGLGFTIAWQGLMVGILTLTAYIIGNNITHEIGMTMAFMTLSLSQLFHAFNIKSTHSIFHRTIFNNKYLWGALLVGMALQMIVMYVPGINGIFSLEPLNAQLFMISLGLALCPIVIVEIVKLFKNHILKK